MTRFLRIIIVCFSAVIALLSLSVAVFAIPLQRPLSSTTWTVGGACGTTIQACINAASNGDTVLIPAGTYVEWLWLNKPVSLLGSGAGSTVVRSSSATRPPLMIYGSSLPPATITSTTVISGLTFTGGHSTTAGGGMALQFPMSPTIRNVIVTGNTASSGGGIGLSAGASATLIDVVITGNVATGDAGYGGGGLLMAGSSVQLINTLLADNQDGAGHGQIEVLAGTLTLVQGTLANATTGSGAGLVTTGGTALLTNTLIASNTYGLRVVAGSITGDYNLFFGNTTNRSGVSAGAHDVTGDPVFATDLLEAVR